MPNLNDTDIDTRRHAARESFSGRGLTDSQMEEAWAISAILNVEIHRSGSFRQKLTDYAHVYAREQKFDALQGEAILRDIYTARFGQTLNQTREGLLVRQNTLTAEDRGKARLHADAIPKQVQDDPKLRFYQAYDRAAVDMAESLHITQTHAKTLIKEAYQEAHGRDLYQVCKALEDTHDRPAKDTDTAARPVQDKGAPAQKPRRRWS